MENMGMPLVSVIVPVYKVERYLRDCLDSIVAQTYSNLEIILVDDGSPDGCPAICDAYAMGDDRVRVVHKENGGVSSARNAGLDIACGKYVVFVDSDDLIAPGMIETLVREYGGEKTAIAVNFVRFADHTPECKTETYSLTSCADIHQFARQRGGLFMWGMLYDRSVIEKLRLRLHTNLINLEDMVWNTCYLSQIDRMDFISAGMYYYRQNPTSITSRCIDKHCQVGSWFLARQSIFQWFFDREMGRENGPVLKFANRYCMNNIVAEAALGKLSYRDYAALRSVPPVRKWTEPMLVFERLLPRVHFAVYMCAMGLRNRLRR